MDYYWKIKAKGWEFIADTRGITDVAQSEHVARGSVIAFSQSWQGVGFGLATIADIEYSRQCDESEIEHYNRYMTYGDHCRLYWHPRRYNLYRFDRLVLEQALHAEIKTYLARRGWTCESDTRLVDAGWNIYEG